MIFLPEVVICVLLLLLLTATAYTTLSKANKLYQKESEALQLLDKTNSNSSNDDKTNSNGTDDDATSLLEKDVEGKPSSPYGTTTATEKALPNLNMSQQESSIDDEPNQHTHQHWYKHDAIKLTALFIVVTVINLIKGGPESGGGPFGLEYCDKTCFWFAESAMFVAILAFAVVARASLLNRLALASSSGNGHTPATSDIGWDESKSTTYPALAIMRVFIDFLTIKQSMNESLQYDE
jgi:hypothetical protein